MNGLGLCMFTSLTGGLPWVDLVEAVTGWGYGEKELLEAGERIQCLRAAFNWRARASSVSARSRLASAAFRSARATRSEALKIRLPERAALYP